MASRAPRAFLRHLPASRDEPLGARAFAPRRRVPVAQHVGAAVQREEGVRVRVVKGRSRRRAVCSVGVGSDMRVRFPLVFGGRSTRPPAAPLGKRLSGGRVPGEQHDARGMRPFRSVPRRAAAFPTPCSPQYRGSMTSLPTSLLRGALAGAAGTTALNAATFLDMTLRRRPASSTPQQTVERGAELVGASLPQGRDEREALEYGLGSLLGTLAGVGVGVVLGAVKGTAGRPSGGAGTLGAAFGLAMLAGNGPMTVLGVTDPRTWKPVDWAADVVPHLAYALVTAAAFEALERD